MSKLQKCKIVCIDKGTFLGYDKRKVNIKYIFWIENRL